MHGPANTHKWKKLNSGGLLNENADLTNQKIKSYVLDDSRGEEKQKQTKNKNKDGNDNNTRTIAFRIDYRTIVRS